MFYALIMTLCLSSCNETIPETFYSMEDCTQALMLIDKAHSDNAVVSFKCEATEEE